MFRNKLTLRRVLPLFIVLFSLLGSACTSFGPSRLISSDIAYNNGVQLAVTREVLVNIVRSRYSDPMQFISVSAINAQWSVSVDASAGVGGLFQSGTAGDSGASVGYSDSPTIT